VQESEKKERKVKKKEQGKEGKRKKEAVRLLARILLPFPSWTNHNHPTFDRATKKERKRIVEKKEGKL